MKKVKLSVSKKTITIAFILLSTITLFSFYFLNLNKSNLADEWYNSSWLYRRSINIQNDNHRRADEDVLIEYDTASLIFTNKLKNNCDDLRFLDSDNKTILPHWIEGGCNTVNTHIWVRIPSLKRNSSTIYMYYGNEDAPSSQKKWAGKFFSMNTSGCSNEWVAESGVEGTFFERFPLGSSQYGETNSLTNHFHSDFTISTTESSLNTYSNSTEKLLKSNSSYEITLSQSQNEEIILPPYLDLQFCSNTNLVIEKDSIAIFDNDIPSGFTRFNQLDNKFPRGNTEYGSSHIFSTHQHIFESKINRETSQEGFCVLKSQDSLTDGQELLYFVSNEESIIPKYLSVLFGQANDTSMAPSGIIMMSSDIPPLGWDSFTEIENMFPYGSSSYGQTGGNNTHIHSITLSAEKKTDSMGCLVSESLASKQTSPIPIIPKNETLGSNNPPYIKTIFVKKKFSLPVSIGEEQEEVKDTALLEKEYSSFLSREIAKKNSEDFLGTAVEHHFEESESENTTTTTSYSDKTTLTFTPEANSTYLLLSSWLSSSGSVDYATYSKLTRTTGTTEDFNELIYYPKDNTDYISGGTFAIDSFGSDPSSQTYKIQYKSSDSSNTSKIKDARIFALKLNSEDKYEQENNRTTTTSTSYQDKVSLVFTPDSSDNYIILASATFDGSNTSYDSRVQLKIDETTYSTINIETTNSQNKYSWVVVKRINLDATEHTIKIQYSSENSENTTGIADARIIAIRTDAFSNNYYTEDETRSTTTSTSYQNFLTLTQTTEAEDHLILAIADLDGTSTFKDGLSTFLSTWSGVHTGYSFNNTNTNTGTDTTHDANSSSYSQSDTSVFPNYALSAACVPDASSDLDIYSITDSSFMLYIPTNLSTGVYGLFFNGDGTNAQGAFLKSESNGTTVILGISHNASGSNQDYTSYTLPERGWVSVGFQFEDNSGNMAIWVNGENKEEIARSYNLLYGSGNPQIGDNNGDDYPGWGGENNINGSGLLIANFVADNPDNDNTSPAGNGDTFYTDYFQAHENVYSTYAQALKGSTSYGEMLIETKDTTNRGYQYFTLKEETLTNSSSSWYLQYKNGNSSSTAGINNARILILELTEIDSDPVSTEVQIEGLKMEGIKIN
jgi:hypothetical protein